MLVGVPKEIKNSEYRVGLDHVLDCGPAVCLIGVQKAASGAECRFASRRPQGEVGHSWQLLQSDLR